MVDPLEVANRDRILELLKDPLYVHEQMRSFTLTEEEFKERYIRPVIDEIVAAHVRLAYDPDSEG